MYQVVLEKMFAKTKWIFFLTSKTDETCTFHQFHKFLIGIFNPLRSDLFVNGDLVREHSSTFHGAQVKWPSTTKPKKVKMNKLQQINCRSS